MQNIQHSTPILAAIALLAAALSPADEDYRSLVTAGERWKFLDNGVAPDASWIQPDFDDSLWATGRGNFGYGEGNEVTTVSYGPLASNKHITTWFRHVFFVEKPWELATLAGRIMRDDGAVVYLNGFEVMRSNMPAGAITPATLSASTTTGADERTFFEQFVPVGAILPGRNVLAVEVHQASPTTPDMSFDFELIARLAEPTCSTTRYAIIGDYGVASLGEPAVAALVKSWNPTLIATTGDNNYPLGEASTIDQNIGQYYHEYIYKYAGVFGPGSATQRFLPTLGNHDWYTAGAQAYFDYFTLPGNERYWEWRSGPVHLFGLDSDTNEPDGTGADSIQANWLQAKLAASDAPWKVVLFHHAAYSSSSGHGNTAYMQWPFAAWGADVVYQGHDHTYERLHVGGIPYIVEGTGGNVLYDFAATVQPGSTRRDNSDYGATMVEACDRRLLLRHYNQIGDVTDLVTLSKLTPPFRLDGRLEQGATLLSADGIRLAALARGEWLYVATRAFSGGDHFVHVARTPGPPRPASWGKAGTVAAWEYFLAKESTSDFTAWFDMTEHDLSRVPGFSQAALDGEWLEGAIHMPTAFGSVPTGVWLAAGAYATAAGGALDVGTQAPNAGSPDGNIDAGEFVYFGTASAGAASWDLME